MRYEKHDLPGSETIQNETIQIKQQYLDFINNRDFACIAAKAALAKSQVECFVADHIACPNDDKAILEFLYRFIDAYRDSKAMYHSAAVIFKGPKAISDVDFDQLMWRTLQRLSDLDSVSYNYDTRVGSDPSSANFSYSLKEEALFIIGLHPASTRPTRRFGYPTIVFNPHMQFEQLRQSGKYEMMKQAVRKRDIAFSGSINPMLRDFGDASEVFQYSGREYDNSWQCPLKINHATTEHNSSP